MTRLGRTLIVAQAPSSKSDPAEPLSGQSGRRLADLAGLTFEAFLERFERVNLLPVYPGRQGKGDAFPMAEAREHAHQILVSHFRGGRRVVLLGRNVAAAFMGSMLADDFPQLTWVGSAINHGFVVARCPHPSGVCRWWNEPKNVEAARAFWRKI